MIKFPDTCGLGAGARSLLPAALGLLVLVSALGLLSCRNEQDILKQRYIAEGMVLYGRHCQNCHGGDGKGFEKLIPPLTDTLYLRLNRTLLPCIVRHGMAGPVQVGGELYDQPMIGNEKLSAMEIAEILTYVTNAFGNRQEMFTVEEVRRALESCPVDSLRQENAP